MKPRNRCAEEAAVITARHKQRTHARILGLLPEEQPSLKGWKQERYQLEFKDGVCLGLKLVETIPL